MLLSYRKQSIDFLRKSMDWFLYDNGLRLERVKDFSCDIMRFNFTQRNMVVYFVKRFGEVQVDSVDNISVF